jgi:hypothetical protein
MEGNCEICGAFRKWLHTHHVKLQAEGGTDAEGVKKICANCHEDIHGGPCGGVGRGRSSLSPEARAKKSKTLLRLWADPEYRKKTLEAQQRGAAKKDYTAIGRKVAAAWTPERRAVHAELLRRIKRKMLAGRWSLKYEHCIECGTSETPHQAHGLCKRCYGRMAMRARLKAKAAKMVSSPTYQMLLAASKPKA